MVGPWMPPSPNAFDRGRHHSCCMDTLLSECIRPWTLSCPPPGCFLVRLHQTMDVIMVGPWIIWAKDALDHGRDYAQPTTPPPNPPWMLSSCQNASDHGRHQGWAMDALGSERIKPWTSSVGPWMLCAQNALVDHACIMVGP